MHSNPSGTAKFLWFLAHPSLFHCLGDPGWATGYGENVIRLQVENTTKYLVIGGVSVVVVIGIVFSLFPARTKIQTAVTNDKINYSYEMPRLETAEIPFELSGRRVVRKYPEVQGQNPTPYNHQKVAPVVAAAGTTGKAFPKIKKETAKQKADKERAKKLAEAARKKNHKVQVVTASDRYKMKPDAPKPQTPPAPQAAFYYPPNPNPVVDDPIVDKKDDDENIDPSTWQSMLQNQPNAANVSKFMKARVEGKVNDAAFYRIVTVLLQDNAPDRKKAALQMLDQDTSPKTYEFIVLASVSARPDVQAQLQALQAKYTTPSKIFLLGRVLASTTNRTVLIAALLQLNQAATSQGPIPKPGQPTGQGIGIHAQLNSMLSVLRKVAQNPDPAVASQAKALLSALQKA